MAVPSVSSWVTANQEKQILTHDQNAKAHTFAIGDCVHVCNFLSGNHGCLVRFKAFVAHSHIGLNSHIVSSLVCMWIIFSIATALILKMIQNLFV